MPKSTNKKEQQKQTCKHEGCEHERQVAKKDKEFEDMVNSPKGKLNSAKIRRINALMREFYDGLPFVDGVIDAIAVSQFPDEPLAVKVFTDVKHGMIRALKENGHVAGTEARNNFISGLLTGVLLALAVEEEFESKNKKESAH